MHNEQRKQTHELLQSRGISQALFAHTDSLVWLTGFAPPLQLGPDLFAGGPPLVWYEQGRFTLIVVDAYEEGAAQFGEQPGCAVVAYPGYTYTEPRAGPQHLLSALKPFKAVGLNGMGIEARSVPLTVAETFSGQGQLTPIDGWLEPLRMIKTPEELAKLRENFALADVGQAAARRAVRVGVREIDVWNAAHSAIQEAAGLRVPLGNDCVVGTRTVNFTGWPLDYEIKPNDSVIVDLGTALDGYWSDGCATYFPTAPTPDQIALHETVSAALDMAISLIRPGARAQEIDRQVRRLITEAGFPEYPHHTGHSVGVSRHEAPRLTPYSEAVLEEGMVIMLEPGIYVPGQTGVRLEDAVLVTAEGAEVLTQHDKSLP